MKSSAEPFSLCPRCGRSLASWHCRMKCSECGYEADCTDVGLPA